MRTTQRSFIMLSILSLVFTACKKDETVIDTSYPEIDIATENAFPKQCSSVKRGEKFVFRATLLDNRELGSYSLDIHHNFDHHSHSTEVNDCEMNPVKAPVKPMLFIKDYKIPAGLKNYQAEDEITIPEDIDPGDYHFLIRLTDKEGWQTLKGLSIKIL